MEKTGFYIISDQFFIDMDEPYLKGNKEENRPHYYCFKDGRRGVYWMIPLSSQVDKYRKIMRKNIEKRNTCDILHIAKLDNGKESVFLIQDIFPITENYIKKEYTVAGNHLILTSEHTVKEISQKARKVLGLRLKHGVKFTPTQVDILAMLKKLQS